MGGQMGFLSVEQVEDQQFGGGRAHFIFLVGCLQNFTIANLCIIILFLGSRNPLSYYNTFK
jgi:hypothetical protein